MFSVQKNKFWIETKKQKSNHLFKKHSNFRNNWPSNGLLYRKIPLSSIGIPGCSRIFTNKYSLGVRILWAAIVLTSTIGFFLNVSYRVDTYLYSNPAVNVETVDNKSVALPAITVCPDVLFMNPIFSKEINKSNYLNITPIFDSIEEEKTDILLLWNRASEYIKIFHPFFIWGRSVKTTVIGGISDVNVTEISSFSGNCLRFYKNTPVVLKDDFTELLLSAYHHTIFGFHRVQIIAEPKDSTYLSRYFILKKGHLLNLKKMLKLHFRIVQRINLNISKNPCFDTDSVERCFENCMAKYFHDRLSSKHNCRLPNMIKYEDIPICEYWQFRSIYSEVDEHVHEFDKKICNCPRKCHETFYLVQLRSYTEGFLDLTCIVVTCSHVITIQREYWPYSFDALLSDIGGSMGLFLGICIISIVELLENLLHQLVYTLQFIKHKCF